MAECLICKQPLKDSIRAMHSKCWKNVDTNSKLHETIDFSKLYTGCDCCNCDICRLTSSNIKHYCFRIYGPTPFEIKCRWC